MNKSVKMLMAGAVIAALSASVYARGGDDCGFGDRGAMSDRQIERMEKMREKQLSTLHDKLKLTAQQEPAWKKFADNKPVFDKANRPDPDEMKKLNAPQRMEKGMENMRTMEKTLTERLSVLKEFYAVLTPEQQKIFDEQTPPFGERRGHHGW